MSETKLHILLDEDLKSALKSKNALLVSVIRMLKADITNTCIKLGVNELNNSGILKVIQRHIKQHNDSIEQFEKGNRNDLAKKEGDELVLLERYMPKQLSDDELKKIVAATIEELGSSTKKDMGKTIKAVLDKAALTVDGKRVSRMVGKLLN